MAETKGLEGDMLKRILVILVLVCFSVAWGFAQVPPRNQADQTKSIAIKEDVNRMGVNARVRRLVLTDGTRLKGFIKEIREESLILVDGYRVVNGRVEAVDRGNSFREIRFDEIREIKSFKGNKGGAIVVGVIVAAAGAGLLYVLGRSVSN